MLKGINQWCYPEGTSLEKVLEYSKEAGFETVELNVNPSRWNWFNGGLKVK